MNYELCTMYLSAGAQFFKLQGAVWWLLVRSHSASGPKESLTQSRRALGTTLHREAYASLDWAIDSIGHWRQWFVLGKVAWSTISCPRRQLVARCPCWHHTLCCLGSIYIVLSALPLCPGELFYCYGLYHAPPCFIELVRYCIVMFVRFGIFRDVGSKNIAIRVTSRLTQWQAVQVYDECIFISISGPYEMVSQVHNSALWDRPQHYQQSSNGVCAIL
jgi:hypothetical protein